MRAKDFIVERDTLMGQPDPVIVISDSNGKQLDRLAMSVAAKKYGFNIAQIRPQFKHQDKVKHKQYTLSAPVSGQPVEETELNEAFEYALVDKDNKIVGVFPTKQRAKVFAPKAKRQPVLKDRLPLSIKPVAPKSKKPGDSVVGIGEEVEVDESGIMYRAGVKKYGKKGMTAIQSAAGKGASAEEIGRIKDKYNKKKKTSESQGLTEEQFDEAAGKKDACYHKVKSRYKVWPSAYASGALVKCRKVGAANWGNKSKK